MGGSDEAVLFARGNVCVMGFILPAGRGSAGSSARQNRPVLWRSKPTACEEARECAGGDKDVMRVCVL